MEIPLIWDILNKTHKRSENSDYYELGDHWDVEFFNVIMLQLFRWIEVKHLWITENVKNMYLLLDDLTTTAKRI